MSLLGESRLERENCHVWCVFCLEWRICLLVVDRRWTLWCTCSDNALVLRVFSPFSIYELNGKFFYW